MPRVRPPLDARLTRRLYPGSMLCQPFVAVAMRVSTITVGRVRDRRALRRIAVGVGMTLVFLLLAPLGCAPESIVTPEPPAPCIETMPIFSFGSDIIVAGRVVAMLGADVSFTAQSSCSAGAALGTRWSVDDTTVIRLTKDWDDATPYVVYTPIGVGRAIITIQRGALRSTLTVEVPPPPPIGRLVLISAGYESTCALNEAGQTFCWGSNRDQLVAALKLGSPGSCPLGSGGAGVPPCSHPPPPSSAAGAIGRP